MSHQDADTIVATAVKSFSFSNYGMDDVDEIKEEEWVLDLAADITEALSLAGRLTGPADD